MTNQKVKGIQASGLWRLSNHSPLIPSLPISHTFSFCVSFLIFFPLCPPPWPPSPLPPSAFPHFCLSSCPLSSACLPASFSPPPPPICPPTVPLASLLHPCTLWSEHLLLALPMSWFLPLPKLCPLTSFCPSLPLSHHTFPLLREALRNHLGHHHLPHCGSRASETSQPPLVPRETKGQGEVPG